MKLGRNLIELEKEKKIDKSLKKLGEILKQFSKTLRKIQWVQFCY